MMDLSICVVTYNSRDEISFLLDSVFSLTSGITFQVYVVDNCSADGTADFVEEKYPDVRVIRSKENAGFGHGHNQALAYLDSRYHAVINPDIRLVEDVFSPLIAYLDRYIRVVDEQANQFACCISCTSYNSYFNHILASSLWFA